MSKPRILVFGGSLRAGSYNQKLATIAAAGATEAGAEVTLIALRDYRMPIFDEDLETEEGMPENAVKLKALFAENDGLIIASPEYNSGITAALKNAIDWVSRATSEDEAPLSVLKGKTAAILAASPGGYGGARSLAQLRPLLENIQGAGGSGDHPESLRGVRCGRQSGGCGPTGSGQIAGCRFGFKNELTAARFRLPACLIPCRR